MSKKDYDLSFDYQEFKNLTERQQEFVIWLVDIKNYNFTEAIEKAKRLKGAL